jgi:hypothetical protein
LAYPDPATATERETPGPERCEEQVRRILQSATFRNAATLQQLFQFLALKTIAGTPEVLKEYTIGVEALGRRTDFDPKTDTIVRVQSHRLRLKLKEYYDVEGSRDQIVINVPKGHYVPTFEIATATTPNPEAGLDSEPNRDFPVAIVEEGKSSDRSRSDGKPESHRLSYGVSVRTRLALLGFVPLVIAFSVAGFWLGDQHARSKFGEPGSLQRTESEYRHSSDSVIAFWTNFLGTDLAPVIAYPDAVFLLDDSNDLFRFRQGASDSRGALVDPHLARQFASNPDLVARAGPLYYENGYTGTGELESIGMLSGLLGKMGVRPTIKSSRDITPDDLKQHNVILLGSPFQNVAVAQLLPPADFTFQNPDSRHEQWRAQIVNGHPQSNEEPAYGTERDRTTHVLKTDYSLITIAPGVVPGRYIAILGGLDTKGTEGATLFATSTQSIDQLFRALAVAGEPIGKSGSPLFQALIRVRLAKGYQVLGADLTTVHRLRSSNSAEAKDASSTPQSR